MSQATEKKRSVAIAVPHTGEWRAELATWIITTIVNARQQDLSVFLLQNRMFPIDGNRNKLVNSFLEETDADYLLFLDSDVVPQCDITQLINHDKDIVTGHVRQCISGGFAATSFLRNKDFAGEGAEGIHGKRFISINPDTISPGEDGLVKVDACGAGMLCIKRGVLEHLKERNIPWFKFLFASNREMLLGEDTWFCETASEFGYDIWLDITARGVHFKTVPI